MNKMNNFKILFESFILRFSIVVFLSVLLIATALRLSTPLNRIPLLYNTRKVL